MKVFLTGATGFVGRHVLSRLLEKEHQVKCLVRKGSENKLPDSDQVEPVVGNIHDRTSFEAAVAGCDAVIHLVGIIGEVGQNTFSAVHTLGTKNVVDAMSANRVNRLIHMSALGTRPGAVARYHKSKYDAEVYIKTNNYRADLGQKPTMSIQYTIFRPSIIHGPDGEFMEMLKGFATGKWHPGLKWFPLPFYLIPGKGTSLLQPVFVDELSQMFVDALDKPETIGKTYDVGGPDTYRMEEMVAMVATAMGRQPKCALHLPMLMARGAATAFEIVCPTFCGTKAELNTDQLIMMQEDNICDSSEAEEVFGIKLSSLPEKLKDYVKQIP